MKSRILTTNVTGFVAALMLLPLLVNANDAVFLKPLGTGEVREIVDGTSWATAYADLAAAFTAANGEKPIYAAQGVYIVAAPLAPEVAVEFYGGFPAVSDAETLTDRDTEAHQTIITGDRTLDDVWYHAVPSLALPGSANSTDTGELVIQNNRVTAPPAYSTDFDCYYAQVKNSNTANGFNFAAGKTISFDGVWFTGFIASGNNGSLFTVASGALAMHDCRIVANVGGSRGLILYSSAADGSFTDTRFSWLTTTECNTIRHQNSSSTLTISNCVFESCYRANGFTGGNVLYGRNSTLVYDSTFTRNLDVTTGAGSDYGGMGNITGGDGANPSFFNCRFTNNMSSTSGQYGNPLLPRATLVKGGLVANNRYQVKPYDGRGYALIGYAMSAASTHMLLDGVVFRNNEVVAPASTATAGTYYLGIIGQNVVAPGSGQPFSVINCVFDANLVHATHPELSGLTPRCCRGPYSLASITGARSQLGVANCTFTGPFVTDCYDVAQWGTDYGYDLHIVNSLFSVSDADIAANWLYADTPARVKAYSCTVKNLLNKPAALAVCDSLEYDDVPLNNAYQPQAQMPGLRTTADISTNVASATASTFAFRPHGSANWTALLPTVGAAITRNDLPIGDINDVVRPYGAFTRGAVQPLTPVAETGKTLTLRCEPLASGTLSGAANAQSLPIGTAIAPVTALPANEYISFSGWYTTNGLLYSADNPLAINLSDDLILIARFQAVTVTLTFDLGPCGTFDETGFSTATVNAQYNTDFPPIPAYTLSDEWVLLSWNAPDKVPAQNTTYTALSVSSALRIIHVVPGGAGLRNGTSWADAYGDVATAYNDAGLYRGEVWLQQGVYLISNTLPMVANVALRGGFTGDESSASEADPAANPTILSGDQKGDDYWLVNNTSPDVANRTPIIFDGKVNPPNPDGSDNYWCPGGNVSDNTAIGLVHPDITVTNVLFAGVTLASFQSAALTAATEGSRGLRFEQCRFVANNGAKEGSSSVSANYEVGAIYLKGVSALFEECSFEGNWWALNLAADNPATNLFRRCRFDGNFGTAKGATIRVRSNMALHLEECHFLRNANTHEKHESATCIVFNQSSDARISDCLFEDNRNLGDSHGMILGNGSALNAFDRCRFIGNKSEQTSYWSASGIIFCGYAADRFLVRDSYFGGNQRHTGTSTSDIWGGILGAKNGSYTFINCTFETNRMELVQADAKGGLFYPYNSDVSLALVNCAFVDNDYHGAGVGSDIRGRAKTLALINTVLGSSDEGYTPLALFPDCVTNIANCVIAGFEGDASAVGANGYLYHVSAAQPDYRRTEVGANGTHAARLRTRTPGADNGRRVWLVDDTVYFYDDVANPAKPWRRALDRTFFADAIDGLTLESATIPDAFGMPRSSRRFSVGPLGVASAGSTLLIR